MPVPSRIDLMRSRLSGAGLLTHTYTRTPVTDGDEDAWGQDASNEGTPTAGVPCLYMAKDQSVRDELGDRLVSTPTLRIAATGDPLAVKWLVSNVKDANGTVLLAGPAVVERIDPMSSAGASVGKRAWLRSGRGV